MKKIYFLLIVSVFIGLLTQGFSCGSPELEGAKLAIKEQKYDDAISILEKEVSKNPANTDAWYLIGDAKGRKSDFEGMNAAFKKCLSISDARAADIYRTHYTYWAIHMDSAYSCIKPKIESDRNYSKAIDEYKLAVAAWPDTSVTYYNLGLICNSTGDIDNAILNLDKAWEMGQDTIAYQYGGRCLLQRGLLKKEKFEKENADLIKLNKNLKGVAKGSLKRDMADILGTPDTKKKDKSNPKREQWEYKKYGVVLTVEGESVVKVVKPNNLKIDSAGYVNAISDLNRSIDVFEMVKKTDPMNNDNLTLLLQSYVGADRITEAVKTLKIAIQNDPGNKVNHDVLGVLYRTAGDYNNAIAEFQEAIKIDPEYSEAVYNLGATYYNWGVKMKNDALDKKSESEEYKKKFQDALPWMEKVSQMKPDDLRVWQSLGTVYAILGQKDKATKAFDEVDRIQKAGGK